MNTSNTKRIGFTLLMSLVAGSALAMEPRGGESGADADLLRGPQVVDASGPDSGGTMDGSVAQSQRAGDMPLRAYLGAVRGLSKAAKENPELALTDEQKEAIKEIGREHAEAIKAFRDEHKDELGGMRERGGERMNQRRGERGERGDGGEAGERGERAERERPSPEEMQLNREKMAELRAKLPSDQDAKKQLWAVLTPAQQDAVKARVEEMRTKRQEKIDQAMDRRGKDAKAPRGDNEHASGRTGEEGSKARAPRGDNEHADGRSAEGKKRSKDRKPLRKARPDD